MRLSLLERKSSGRCLIAAILCHTWLHACRSRGDHCRHAPPAWRGRRAGAAGALPSRQRVWPAVHALGWVTHVCGMCGSARILCHHGLRTYYVGAAFVCGCLQDVMLAPPKIMHVLHCRSVFWSGSLVVTGIHCSSMVLNEPHAVPNLQQSSVPRHVTAAAV